LSGRPLLREWLRIAGGCWFFASLFLFFGRRRFDDLLVPATATAGATPTKRARSLPRRRCDGGGGSGRNLRRGRERARRRKQCRCSGRRRRDRCDGGSRRDDHDRDGEGDTIAPEMAARSWSGAITDAFFDSLLFSLAVTNVGTMVTLSVPPPQAPQPPPNIPTPLARASRTRAVASMAGRSAAVR